MSKYFNLDVISLNECLVIPSLPIMNSPSTAPATVPLSSLVALSLALAIVIAFSYALFEFFGLSFLLCATFLLTAHWVDTLVTFSRSVGFFLLIWIALLIDSNPRQQEGLLTVEIIQSINDRLLCQLLHQLVTH